MDDKEIKVKVKKQIKPKKSDVEAARQFLQSVGGVFAMQANMVRESLKQKGCDIVPAFYYPDRGNAIYMGLKLILPSEKDARYMYRCFEIASRGGNSAAENSGKSKED